MDIKYSNIIKHLPSLEDHAHLFMYYGKPYSDECDVYGADEDENLILSHECDDLCYAIADLYERIEWLDILKNHHIELKNIFVVDVEQQEYDVISALLLYLVISITYEDKFIDALNNGFLIRLIKRLEALVSM